jgi:hypothetical protein
MEKLELHKKLIAESLENWNGLKKASIDHFAQTGKASGSFFLALMEYAESYHNEMQVASHPTLPSDKEIRSVRNTFVTPQEKLAFNSGLNIASARIAEMERELQEAKNLVRSITEFADGMKVLDGEALRVLKNTARRVLSDKPTQFPRK